MRGETDYAAFGLEHFEKSVNSAAQRVRGLWLGYIALVTYLIITVGAVTHRDLLLENPVRLPVLNVDLSLTGFFAVAPVFFIINHFYLLLHLVGLRRRISEYNGAVTALVPGREQDMRRRELDSFVIVQAFGGTAEERLGATAKFLKAIIWITVIIAPVLVLLEMQIWFLAYHHDWLTWVHCVAIVVDLGLLWLFWPAILKGTTELHIVRPWAGPVPVASCSLAAAIVAGSCTVLTFPSERMDRLGLLWAKDAKPEAPWQTPQDQVFWPLKAALPDNVRNLDLQGAFLVDRDQLDKIKKRKPDDEKPWNGERTLILSNPAQGKIRNLIEANLSDADLRGVSLRGALMQKVKLDRTNLQGASLVRASLQSASLRFASLQGASLQFARLQGASLVSARLQGVSLDGANLQGASLDGANLQGASLEGARLQGASLKDARLQGASLEHAYLDGASLQGASLRFARLFGAILVAAKLQGASLEGANFSAAELHSTFLWRTSGQSAGNAYLSKLRFDRVPDFDFFSDKPLKFRPALDQALDGVNDKDKAARERIEAAMARLKPGARTAEQDEADRQRWLNTQSKALPISVYQKALAGILQEISCSISGKPYVTQGVVLNHFNRESDVESLPLARVLLKGDAQECPGASGINKEVRAKLQRHIAEREKMIKQPSEP